MRLFLLTCAILANTTQMVANDFWGKTRYTATIGANATYFNQNTGNTVPQILPTVGVEAQHYLQDVGKGFYLTAGLHYAPMTHNLRQDDFFFRLSTGLDYYKEELTAHYVTLPVHVGYQIRIGRNTSFLPAVGFYAGYCLGGNIKTLSKKNTGEESSTKAPIANYINRFDGGVSVSLGLQFGQHFRCGLDSKIGLNNLSRNNKDAVIRTRRFGITASYVF